MADVSRQWQALTGEQFVGVDDDFLASFRAPGSKNRFVAWDPYEPSTRYLKFLLFNTARAQSARFFEAYRQLDGRSLGNPLTVRVADCDIDADYLAAVEEWEFLDRAVGGAMGGVRTIVEIGAGFGRTCHALLTLCPSIDRYVIVDLDPMLRLSRAYLGRVMPGAPVEFVSNRDTDTLDGLRPDLVINIDSFQEMPPEVIDAYMRRVVGRAPRFYSKNPVGKYAPATVGRPDLSPARMLDVFALGYCQEVIDIFDEGDLEVARERCLRGYCPPSYRVVASKVMDLFPYYLHALYAR